MRLDFLFTISSVLFDLQRNVCEISSIYISLKRVLQHAHWQSNTLLEHDPFEKGKNCPSSFFPLLKMLIIMFILL